MKNLSLFFTGHKISPRPDHQTFLEAFVPDEDHSSTPANITMAWIEQVNVTIDALITFRNAVTRWHARGWIPDAEFFAEAERLRLVELADWFDYLMAIGLTANALTIVKNDNKEIS